MNKDLAAARLGINKSITEVKSFMENNFPEEDEISLLAIKSSLEMCLRRVEQLTKKYPDQRKKSLWNIDTNILSQDNFINFNTVPSAQQQYVAPPVGTFSGIVQESSLPPLNINGPNPNIIFDEIVHEEEADFEEED